MLGKPFRSAFFAANKKLRWKLHFFGPSTCWRDGNELRRGERNWKKSSPAGRPVASRFERKLGSGYGYSRLSPKSVVGVSPGACVESRHLFPHRNEQMRLSHLLRTCQPKTLGAVPNRIGSAKGGDICIIDKRSLAPERLVPGEQQRLVSKDAAFHRGQQISPFHTQSW